MKLTGLSPRWVGAGGRGVTNAMTGEPVAERHGVGVGFECPCGCEDRAFVYFSNPLDGSPYDTRGAPTWDRTGDTFETLTLKPSIQRIGGCGWHGYITDGEAHE